jgi:deoxyribodipyrimidine photolyase-related protein
MHWRGVTVGDNPSVAIILGNQLFPVAYLKAWKVKTVFMAEDDGLCTHFKYHKHKLVLFLAAMREYARLLVAEGFDVHYVSLAQQPHPQPYEEKLRRFLKPKGSCALHAFEIEDKFMEQRLGDFAKNEGHSLEIHETPMFLTPRAAFKEYLAAKKRPFMRTFYEWQRRRLRILIDPDEQPVGGKWSFDTENRKKLGKDVNVPAVPRRPSSVIVNEVSELVTKRFPEHPGDVADFMFPVTREAALQQLDSFLAERFRDFGEFEDAISQRSDFIFHSVLTPALNLGLLTPEEVVARALRFAEKKRIPLNSLEGFIRQVIGWREFIRGIYQNYSLEQDRRNFFKHDRRLNRSWYEGTTGIDPLDHVIRKAIRLGYCHHIERLMIAGNLMLLAEISPPDAHAWFMELFVDSSDWVMGPNVYGMALFSDGGIFATKPYICASNYLLKMSDFKRGPWCEDVDALFWSFLGKHETFFAKNPRLNMLLKTWTKRPAADRKKVEKHAESVRKRLSA